MIGGGSPKPGEKEKWKLFLPLAEGRGRGKRKGGPTQSVMPFLSNLPARKEKRRKRTRSNHTLVLGKKGNGHPEKTAVQAFCRCKEGERVLCCFASKGGRKKVGMILFGRSQEGKNEQSLHGREEEEKLKGARGLTITLRGKSLLGSRRRRRAVTLS